MRIGERHHARAVALGALDGHQRRLEADDLTVALIAVEHEQCPAVEPGFRMAIRVQPAFEQCLDVARRHTDAVRVMAGEVGSDEIVGDELCLACFAAAGHDNFTDRAGQGLGPEDQCFFHQSGLMPPRSTTLVQRSTSSFMKRPNSWGVPATTSKPIWFMRSRISGERSAFTAASLSLAMISRGVFAGAAAACHEVTTSPGNPASPTAGTFGSCGWRSLAVTASAFMRL